MHTLRTKTYSYFVYNLSRSEFIHCNTRKISNIRQLKHEYSKELFIFLNTDKVLLIRVPLTYFYAAFRLTENVRLSNSNSKTSLNSHSLNGVYFTCKQHCFCASKPLFTRHISVAFDLLVSKEKILLQLSMLS